jgi:hypothetical protein
VYKGLKRPDFRDTSEMEYDENEGERWIPQAG